MNIPRNYRPNPPSPLIFPFSFSSLRDQTLHTSSPRLGPSTLKHHPAPRLLDLVEPSKQLAFAAALLAAEPAVHIAGAEVAAAATTAAIATASSSSSSGGGGEAAVALLPGAVAGRPLLGRRRVPHVRRARQRRVREDAAQRRRLALSGGDYVVECVEREEASNYGKGGKRGISLLARRSFSPGEG